MSNIYQLANDKPKEQWCPECRKVIQLRDLEHHAHAEQLTLIDELFREEAA